MSSTPLTHESKQAVDVRRVGVLGGGQLGRMLALAGYPLGVHCVFVDPSGDAPAGKLAEQLSCDYLAAEGQNALSGCEVVTYEFESVPVEATLELAKNTLVYPPPKALAKGAELGAFELGSTVVVIAEAGKVALDINTGDAVRMGQRIGSIHARPPAPKPRRSTRRKVSANGASEAS